MPARPRLPQGGRQKDGLRGFFWPRKKYESDEQRRDYAERIIAALE